jgi:drug/metabolite transporter (DMT)-like permease
MPLADIPFNGWFAISYLVLLGSIMTFAAFIYALKRLPPAQASVYAYINPIVAVILGALLNQEKLSAYIVFGTLITLVGVFLVNTGFRKSERTSEKG